MFRLSKSEVGSTELIFQAAALALVVVVAVPAFNAISNRTPAQLENDAALYQSGSVLDNLNHNEPENEEGNGGGGKGGGDDGGGGEGDGGDDGAGGGGNDDGPGGECDPFSFDPCED